MAKFNVYDYRDKLKSGEKLLLDRSIYAEDIESEIQSLLQTENEASLTEVEFDLMSKEQEAVENAKLAMGKWVDTAKELQIIRKTMEYLKYPKAEHTNNQWNITERYGGYLAEISNATFKMYISTDTDTKYRDGKSIPVKWRVSWWLTTNAPMGMCEYRNVQIAGQERKTFTTEAAMDKYIEGRKKAYARYFTEEYPIIPIDYKNPFMVHGVLLPGYKIEEINKEEYK